MYNLPQELINYIYEFDAEHREKFSRVLHHIRHKRVIGQFHCCIGCFPWYEEDFDQIFPPSCLKYLKEQGADDTLPQMPKVIYD